MNKICNIEGCHKKRVANGLCTMHYRRVRRGETDMRPETLAWRQGDPRYKNKSRLCEVPGCTNPFYAKGLCQNHYNLKLRKGFLASRLFSYFGDCSVENCQKEAIGRHTLCRFHYERHRNGTPLDRPFGVKGELNCNWKGGVAQYPNHSEMKKMRKIVLEEENYTCHYCGKSANQIHHIDLSKDNHSRENLTACCQSCNSKRGTSKYKRLYGKTQKELAQEFGCSMHRIRCLHSKVLTFEL